MNQCLQCQTQTENAKFCSQSCSARYINVLSRTRPKPIKEPKNKCSCCANPTNNPKFCSKSCAAKQNNKLKPKRSIEPQNKCLDCGKRCSRRTGSRKNQLCKRCSSKKRSVDYSTITKGDCVESCLTSYASKHKYEKIRQHAKRTAHLFGWERSCCERCGYTKHTELCHIRSISSFSDDTRLEEINSRENICFLCPNCHWELDHLNGSNLNLRQSPHSESN